MRTTERLTVTVQQETAEAVRQFAARRGVSVSALVDRALRDALIAEAMRTEAPLDDEWLAAVAETVDGQTAA